MIGVATPIIYQILGVSLLGFAGIVAWTATRKPIDTFLAALISIADFLWVLGTILLFVLASGTLNPEGIFMLSGIAIFVMGFGLYQLHGINRVYSIPGKPDTQRLCVMVDTPVQPEKIWPLIADLGSIQDYSPNLTQVILKDNAEPGVDAVRQCTDVNGKTWSEHCQRYDEQARSIKLEFLPDEPGFPYPFKTMSGGWDVESSTTGSTVHIWFEVTPRYGPSPPDHSGGDGTQPGHKFR